MPSLSSRLSLAAFLSLSFSRAQVPSADIQAPENPTGTVSETLSPQTQDIEGEMRIIGPLYGEIVQEPALPLPQLRVGGSDILTSQKRRLAQREITFQKLAPLSLPAPPPPLVDERDQTAASEADVPQKPHLNVLLGASVHIPDNDPERAVTFIQLWNGPSEKPVSLWVNANFLWLTGFAEYESAEAKFSLLMAISSGGPNAPDNLNFPASGKASLIVVDGEPTEEDLAPIYGLLRLYNDNEKLQRLKQAYDLRQQEAARIAAERAADPPEKRPILLRYWRLDAAGLNGATPKPASIR